MTLQDIGARTSNRVRRRRVDGRVAIAWGVIGDNLDSSRHSQIAHRIQLEQPHE